MLLIFFNYELKIYCIDFISIENILKNFNGYFIYVVVIVELFLFMVINVCGYIVKIFLVCGKVILLII